MRIFVRAAVRVILIFMAIEAVLYAVRYIPNLMYSYHSIGNSDYWFELSIILGTFIISVIILGLLWWRTDWLVRVLTGRVYDRELVISTSNVNLMKVAMRIVGLILLVYSIPTLIGLVGYHLSLPKDYTPGVFTPSEIMGFITAGVKIILGVWLMVGTKGIAQTLTIIDDKVHMIEPAEKQAEKHE